MKARIVYFFIAVSISVIALISVASLSSYAHKTDIALMTTQAQLQALQKDYDQLKADHAALKGQYDQARRDLEAANGRVASIEGELKTAKEQHQELEQTIEMARLNANVLDGLFDNSVSLEDMEARIDATGNAQLMDTWKAINNEESLGNFLMYLSHSVWESLN